MARFAAGAALAMVAACCTAQPRAPSAAPTPMERQTPSPSPAVTPSPASDDGFRQSVGIGERVTIVIVDAD